MPEDHLLIEQIGPDTFEVTSRDVDGETRHGVALTDTLLKELTGGKISKAACVRAAFQFLLERKAIRAVPRRFDVAMIEASFPDFRATLIASFQRIR